MSSTKHIYSHWPKFVNRSSTTGQAMILTALTLGGVILTATTIAGLLTVYQLRQANDLANSAKAIFAADTGIEWGLYQFFEPTGPQPQPTMTNGATFTTKCYDSLGNQLIDCTDVNTADIRSLGTSLGVGRAFELTF